MARKKAKWGRTVPGSKWSAGKLRKCHCVMVGSAQKRCFRSKNLAQKYKNSLGGKAYVQKRMCLRDRFKA